MSNYSISYDREWTWIHFTDKPAESILECLRKFARFSRRRVAWYTTQKLEESQVAALLTTTDSDVIIPAEVIPAPIAPKAPAPRKTTSAPKKSEADNLRAWFNGLDFENIPDDENKVTTAWKYDVSIFHHKADSFGRIFYSLTTRSPQQRTAGRWSATRWGISKDPQDLRTGLERFITEREAKESRRLDLQAAKTAARDSFVNPYKPGDILYSSWGYDQTNREFYQVLEVGTRSIKICEIRQERTESTGPDSWNTAGIRGSFIDTPKWTTLQINERGQHSVPSPIHGCLYLWDGVPVYASDGH